MDQNNSRLGKNIINLSSKQLNSNESKLLEKGLNFVPAPSKIDQKLLSESVQKLSRRLKLKYHFQNGPKSRIKKNFRKKSNWTPPDKAVHPKLIEKLSEMENNIRNIRIKKESPNLKKSELKALHRLKNDPSIVIKPADKGSATVIMNKTDYVFEANRQLSNTTHYQKLNGPIYPKTARQIDKILRKMINSGISEKEYEYLKPPTNPRERRFYLLPKIHKDPEKWTIPNKIPPGRPIVSDCESESYCVSEYIDSFLAPLATKHPAYVRDTQHFLEILSETALTPNCLLATLDVDSLYTNIDNDAGIRAVGQAFKNNPIAWVNKVRDNRRDKEILELLKLCLENNDFIFDNEWYLQISGTAMGKKFAPNYANIFMADWESQALAKCNKEPLLYLRFLDDIFVIWPHSESEFWEFFDTLNNHSPSIKLKATIHPKQIDFLDVTIFKGNRFNEVGILDTKVYFKPTDTHELLHKESFHPKHTFPGIIKSQIMRFHRICNNKVDFDEACTILFTSLRSRHYSNRFLRGIKSKTLMDIQVKLELWGPQNGRVGPCGGKRCQTCKFVPKTNYIMNGTHKIKFNQTMDCNSTNVIYLIHCSHCEQRYVGETGRSLRDRFNGHKRDINHGISTNVADHFFSLVGCDFETKCKLYPLEKLQESGSESRDKEYRLERENYWIRKLETYSPYGLNTGYDPNKDGVVPLVIRYSSTSVEISKSIQKTYFDVQKDMPSVFPFKFITAYEKNRSLKDFLCSSIVRN